AVFYGQAYRDGLESLAVMDGVAIALADQQISTADLERAEACSDQIIVLREDLDPVLIVDAERDRAAVVEHQMILELIRTKVSRPEIEQTARHHVLASPQARTEVQSELLKTENVESNRLQHRRGGLHRPSRHRIFDHVADGSNRMAFSSTPCSAGSIHPAVLPIASGRSPAGRTSGVAITLFLSVKLRSAQQRSGPNR